MKRLLDLVAAGLGLICAMPVLLAIAVSILLEDGWPVFFAHQRVGRKGLRFGVLKFRTMRQSTRGTQVTAAGDARITRLGRFLRRHKLDELPQFWNVLRGQMSLVGPRPEVPEYIDSENPAWRKILRVRPGITDLATLVYRNEEELLAASADPELYYRESVLPKKLALNLAYLAKRSFASDLKLIALTVYYSLFPGRFRPDRIQARFLTR